MSRLIDLSTQQYGHLTVIGRAQANDSQGRPRWECQCRCGRIITVCGWDLRNHRTQSCGCLKRERTSQRRTIDVLGKRFGRLIVISRDETTPSPATRGVRWHCRCDCGQLTIKYGHLLASGHTTSCGCRIGEGSRLRGMRRPQLTCKQCGVVFMRSPSAAKGIKGKFCSRACKDRFQSGINSPKYRHGLSATIEYHRAKEQRRRGIKSNAEGSYTVLQIVKLLKKQKYRCYLCNRPFRYRKAVSTYVYHIDHWVALSRGGSNNISNIRLLCPSCNFSKRDLTLAQLARRQELLLVG